MSEDAPSLFKKLAEVMGEVGYVEKRGWNDFQKYKYVTEADLIEAVRGKLTERGVLLLPKASSITENGQLVHVHMQFLFVDSETGERFETAWIGSGSDKGDKALYKAYTGAVKYFLMKTFLIPTGDDPEADTETDRAASGPAPVSRSQSGIPERYEDCLRMAIRHFAPDELADEDEFARLVGAATTEPEREAVIDGLEAALTDHGGDPAKVRARWMEAHGVVVA